MTAPPEDVFLLARRRMRRRALLRLTLGLLLVGAVVADLIAPFFAGPDNWRLLLLPLIGGAFLLAQGGLRLVASRDAAIRLTDDAVVFPPGIATMTARRVPYADIELLVAQAVPGRSRVVIGSRSRVHVVQSIDIGGELTLEKFYATLQARIARRPGGAEQLTHLEHGLAVTRKLFSRRARATELILLVLIAAYVVEITTGVLSPFAFLGSDLGGFARLGAIVPSLVEEGQWHRLITGTLLHGGLIHIYLNGLAIWIFGGILERLIGGHRLMIVYITSAVAGSLASLLASKAPLSLGASGAAFGIIGAFAALQWRHGRRLPPGVGQSRRWWIVILGLNAALPFALPMIDYWAHLGGFVNGALVGMLLLYSPSALRPDRPAPFAVAAVSMALVGVSAAAIASGIDHERHGVHIGTVGVIERYAAVGEVPPDRLNELVWLEVAIKPQVTTSELDSALRVMDRVLAEAPDQPEFIDTHATLLHRRGQVRDAIAGEQRALTLEGRAFYATQLRRFLRTGHDAPIDGLTLSATDGNLSVRGAAGRQRVLAAVRIDDTDRGLLWATVDGAAPVSRIVPAEGALDESTTLPAEAQFEPLRAEPVAADTPLGWRYWPDDPQALELD